MQADQVRPVPHAASARAAAPKASSYWLFRAATLVGAACVVGVFADRGAWLPAPWNLVAETGTPWLLLAFVAGRSARRGALMAGLWGGSVVAVGLLAYYGWLLLGQEVALGTLLRSYRAPAWLVVGPTIGFAFGVLGALSRYGRSSRLRTGAWSVVIAVPLAESFWVWRWSSAGDRWTGASVFAGVALLGLVSALRTSRIHAWGLVLSSLFFATLAVQVQAVLLRF